MLSLLELTALGFAAYRVTQLVVHDSITGGWRQRIELWHATKHTSRVRTFIRDLISCTFCLGFHASWLTVMTYLLASGQWQTGVDGFLLFGIQSFAVAGIQAILSRYEDTLPAAP